MSSPKEPLPVKPVVALIVGRADLAPAVLLELAKYLGPPDLVSPLWPFAVTDYYATEMGRNLQRGLASFLHLAHPARLPWWKFVTNELEARFSLGGRRLVNLDPGYLARERLVLATGKNYSHRLTLEDGIYGDLTLLFTKAGVSPLPWTYPDYYQGPLPGLMQLVRRKYLWQLRKLSEP